MAAPSHFTSLLARSLAQGLVCTDASGPSSFGAPFPPRPPLRPAFLGYSLLPTGSPGCASPLGHLVLRRKSPPASPALRLCPGFEILCTHGVPVAMLRASAMRIPAHVICLEGQGGDRGAEEGEGGHLSKPVTFHPGGGSGTPRDLSHPRGKRAKSKCQPLSVFA